MSKLLVIDTETGGIDAGVHSILTFGAVVLDGLTIGAELDIQIVEDPVVATPRALEINRIDLVHHAKEALTPGEAATAITHFMRQHFQDELGSREKVVLCGHNVAFDVSFLRRLFRLADAPFDELFSHRTLDTASVIRFLGMAGVLPPTVTTSDLAFAHFRIEPPPADRHTALGDARATANLVRQLVLQTRPSDTMRGAA